MLVDIKGLPTDKIHPLEIRLHKEKKLLFVGFLTFNSLRPMPEELFYPEITEETALCYYFSRDFVQEKIVRHHKTIKQTKQTNKMPQNNNIF